MIFCELELNRNRWNQWSGNVLIFLLMWCWHSTFITLDMSNIIWWLVYVDYDAFYIYHMWSPPPLYHNYIQISETFEPYIILLHTIFNYRMSHLHLKPNNIPINIVSYIRHNPNVNHPRNPIIIKSFYTKSHLHETCYINLFHLNKHNSHFFFISCLYHM